MIWYLLTPPSLATPFSSEPSFRTLSQTLLPCFVYRVTDFFIAGSFPIILMQYHHLSETTLDSPSSPSRVLQNSFLCCCPPILVSWAVPPGVFSAPKLHLSSSLLTPVWPDPVVNSHFLLIWHYCVLFVAVDSFLWNDFLLSSQLSTSCSSDTLHNFQSASLCPLAFLLILPTGGWSTLGLDAGALLFFHSWL